MLYNIIWNTLKYCANSIALKRKYKHQDTFGKKQKRTLLNQSKQKGKCIERIPGLLTMLKERSNSYALGLVLKMEAEMLFFSSLCASASFSQTAFPPWWCYTWLVMAFSKDPLKNNILIVSSNKIKKKQTIKNTPQGCSLIGSAAL